MGLSFPPFTWMFSCCLDSSSPLPPHSFLIGGWWVVRSLLCLGRPDGRPEPNLGQRKAHRPCTSCLVELCVHGQSPACLLGPCSWLWWATGLELACGWCSENPGPLAWGTMPGPWGERVVALGAWAFQPPAMQKATGPGREQARLWVAGSPGPQAAGCGCSCSSCFLLLPRSSSNSSLSLHGPWSSGWRLGALVCAL